MLTVEQAVREQQEYELAYRVLLPDGTIRHVNNLAYPVFASISYNTVLLSLPEGPESPRAQFMELSRTVHEANRPP